MLIPTFHPAYLLRNPSAKREVWEDMKKVRAMLQARRRRSVHRGSCPVAVPVPALDLLTYRVPEAMAVPVPGARVVVPLGARRVTGIVVDAAVGCARQPVHGARRRGGARRPAPFVPPSL